MVFIAPIAKNLSFLLVSIAPKLKTLGFPRAPGPLGLCQVNIVPACGEGAHSNAISLAERRIVRVRTRVAGSRPSGPRGPRGPKTFRKHEVFGLGAINTLGEHNFFFA